jgi:hypothetical protein
MFNRIAGTLGTIAAMAALSLTAPHAHAAAVSATASVISIEDTFAYLDFTNAATHSFLSDASTPNLSGFDASSVLQSYNFNESNASGSSFAAIDNTFAPMPGTSAGASGSGQGSATVLWSIDWVATGEGTVHLDLGYLYSVTVENLLPGEIGIGSSLISALLEYDPNAPALCDACVGSAESFHFFNNQEGNTSGFGTLQLVWEVAAGQTGSLSIVTASNAVAAPVPVPPAVWLLGSALLGLTRVARRRA